MRQVKSGGLKYAARSEFWEKCNDETLVRQALDLKNFDTEVQLIESIANQTHLIYKGAFTLDHF